MKSVIQKVLQGTVSEATAVLAAICLIGCGQGGHDHDDPDHKHPHSQQDEDGREHHGAEDSDANDPTAAVSEEDLEAQRAAYPLKVCLVEGEELGSMGDPAEYVHEGRLVLFCCKGCTENFQAEPSKYLARLDKALESVSASGAEAEE